ncbi:MAG: hypothetical protein E7305_08290 [Butyrivibrio sp.]|nr:hypothetical protein [Butyrivibrio sp.]
MFLIVLLITRLPYAFLISILIAFTALIPVVGAFIGCAVGAFLFAVTVGSSLMGVAGMLFFIPLTSVIYSLIKEWTYKRLKDKSVE